MPDIKQRERKAQRPTIGVDAQQRVKGGAAQSKKQEIRKVVRARVAV